MTSKARARLVPQVIAGVMRIETNAGTAMTSTEVYREARGVLGPWCKASGFKRTSGGMLGWYRSSGDKYLLFWLQCSQDGWDRYAGSRFTVEFQLSATPQIGVGGKDAIRHRLPFFLNESELHQVREIQNSVIRDLERPPSSHPVLQMGSRLADYYLGKFEPICRDFTRADDVWMRYTRPEHVRQWSSFLLTVLPRVADEYTANTA